MSGLFGQAYPVTARTATASRAPASSPTLRRAAWQPLGCRREGRLPDSFAGLSVGPILALDYARAKVNGYTEAGDAALTLDVSGQSHKALNGQAGLEVRGDIAGLHPFMDVTAEHNFSGDDRLITSRKPTRRPSSTPGRSAKEGDLWPLRRRSEREHHGRAQRRRFRHDRPSAAITARKSAPTRSEGGF